MLLLSLLRRASRAPAVASRSFRLTVPILAIAVETCFNQNLAALATTDLLDRSTISNKRINHRNPRHFGRRSPKNLSSFSGCRSFRFSGSSRYLLLAHLPGPPLDPKAPCATFLQALPYSLTAYNDAHLQMNKGDYTYGKVDGTRQLSHHCATSLILIA